MQQINTARLVNKQRMAAFKTMLGIGLLFALLMVPGHPDHFTLSHLQTLPLDVPAAVLLLILVGPHISLFARLVLIVLVLIVVLLRFGDLMSRIAFGRAFNPIAEWHLIQQGWSLTANTLGRHETIAIVISGVVMLLLLGLALFYSLSHLRESSKLFQKSITAMCLVIVLAGLAASSVSGSTGYAPPLRWVLADELIDRINYTRWAVVDQAEFSKDLETDEFATTQPTFAALAGRDVVIVYVESYGRSFIDHQRFSDLAKSRMQNVMDTITDAGLHVRSSWVDSPIRGGRSWLAHSTVASGLKLSNQARFDRLISSDRPSLHRLFSQAGWTSSVVLPVVKTDWIEGAWYQVDRFFDLDALDYQGKDFGYVTVPDQYTFTAFEQKIRGTAKQPLMAHIGLLDSHAPWGPLPKHQDWDDIEDGSVFDGTQRYGARHSWANPEPVRKAYGVAVDQNLKLVGEYLARYADNGLFIVLGDHQPASVIAGWAPDSYVPMHVFANDQSLLERLPDEFFSHSMTPNENASALPMESIRGLLGTVFE